MKRVQKLLAGSAARVRVKLSQFLSISIFLRVFFFFLIIDGCWIFSSAYVNPFIRFTFWDPTIQPPPTRPLPSKFKDIMTSFIAPILPLPSIVPDLLNYLHHSSRWSIFSIFKISPLRSSHHLCGNPAKKCLTWVQSWGNNQTKSPVFVTSYVTTDLDPWSVSVPWKTNKKNQGLFLIKGKTRDVTTKGNAWTLIGYKMGKKASVKNVSIAGACPHGLCAGWHYWFTGPFLWDVTLSSWKRMVLFLGKHAAVFRSYLPQNDYVCVCQGER